MPRHLLSILDFSREEIYELLDIAMYLKKNRGSVSRVLENRSLAMLFEKPSTRTRISFEVAMTELGGHSLYLGPRDLQLGRGETISDTAKVMSRYVHGIMARVYRHSTLEEMAASASVPVINGLSDLEHPCQLLADLLTIREYKGDFEGLSFAWVGDGNNVCNSAILACSLMGMEVRVATPQGYEPDRGIVERAERLGGRVFLTHSPVEAVRDADVIYTDTWVSMGDEKEAELRLKAFQGYQVDEELVSHAMEDVVVMHCLPAHRGEEITGEVLDGSHSVVFDQAENRLHAQKAVLLKLLG